MFAVKLFCYLIRSNNIGVTYRHYLFMRSIPRSGAMATSLYFRQTVISAIKKWLNISKLTEHKTKRNITPVKVAAVSYSSELVLQLPGYTDILLNLN